LPDSVAKNRVASGRGAEAISLFVSKMMRVSKSECHTPAHLIRRFPNLLLLRSCLWQSISTFPRSRFALRANLRLVYLAPALALDCLSLWTCAIARVFAPARQTPLCA
jgi:hypothetical protein